MRLKALILKVQGQMIGDFEMSLGEARRLLKVGDMYAARACWMAAQDKLIQAGIIAETCDFDNFTFVIGRLVPTHFLPRASSVRAFSSTSQEEREQGHKDGLMEAEVAMRFAGHLAELHKDIKQAELLLRVMRRMRDKATLCCWELWQAFVEEQHDQRERERQKALAITRCLLFIKHLGLARAWATWVDWWSTRQRAKSVVMQMLAQRMHGVLCFWHHHASLEGEDRREERGRLESAWEAAERHLRIAEGMRAGSLLLEGEQTCHSYLLTLKWTEEDLLPSQQSTTGGRGSGSALVGFDAASVEEVDWVAFCARAAEKLKLRPAVLSRIGKELMAEAGTECTCFPGTKVQILTQQAAYFFREVVPQKDEFSVDVAGILRQLYACKKVLGEAGSSDSKDDKILALVAGRRTSIREMEDRCAPSLCQAP